MAMKQSDTMDWIAGYVKDPAPSLDAAQLVEFHQHLFEIIISKQAETFGISHAEALRGLIDGVNAAYPGYPNYFDEPINR